MGMGGRCGGKGNEAMRYLSERAGEVKSRTWMVCRFRCEGGSRLLIKVCGGGVSGRNDHLQKKKKLVENVINCALEGNCSYYLFLFFQRREKCRDGGGMHGCIFRPTNTNGS